MKLTGLSEKVFLDRYSLKDKAGKSMEKRPEEMWRRIAKAVAQVEKKKASADKWEKEFYSVLKDFKYVPGGRILSGAGTGFAVSFYNCFVIPSPSDSRGGILKTLGQMVEIMARGGGVGINLSSLRPRGARVNKVNGFSSGPINWAELFSVATKDIIQQGGCFTGDTRIMTHLGLIKINEIIEESKKNYYTHTHQGRRKISYRFDNGIKDVFEVETEGGYKVKTTAEHKFLTFDRNGHFYLQALSSFKTGDHVVLLPTTFSNEIPEAILNTKIPTPSKFSFGRQKIVLPQTLDKKLAFLLGVYASDGSRIKDTYAFAKGIRFAVDGSRKKDLLLLTNILQGTFDIDPKIRRGDGNVFNVSIYSRNLVEFLRLNRLIKDNSNTVFVPEQIFTSPKSVVEAFVAGVFFGDGSNQGGKGGFRISSVNKRFLEDISLLLLNLGIASKLTSQIRTVWQTLYTLNINGNKYMKRFFDVIQNYTEKAYDRAFSQRDGFYNFPFNILERFVYLSGIQRTIAYANPTTSYKTLRFIEKDFTNLKKQDIRDGEILTTTITDKIKSITYVGKQQVYDLEVDDLHLLSGNGFYTSNSRRGALMLMLWDWHPDIEEFITVKQDLNKINGANLSLCISDTFMEAVEKDKDWPLVFPDIKDPEYDQKWTGDLEAWKQLGKKVIVHKIVKARKIWDLVATAAWKSAEPGVVFMERYNKLYNNYYWNKIICVNPCVTGDTLIATELGWLPAKELKPGIKIATPNGLKTIDKVYNNGKQKIFKVRFSDGGELKATADHKLKVVRNKKFEWIKISDLKTGNKVIVADRSYFQGDKHINISSEVAQYAKIHNIYLDKANDRDFGFIFGVAIGDGYFRQMGKKYGYSLKIALGRKEVEWKHILEEKFKTLGVIPSYVRYEHKLIHVDGTVVTHGSDQLLFYKFANILGLLGLPDKRAPQKEIPEILFNLGLDFQRGLLDGLFSTDGSVSLKSYDPLLRLSSASLKLLQQVRLLLLNFGIHGRIYASERKKTIYDGKDMTGTGIKYELLIMNEGIAKFYREVNITHPDKKAKLKKIADEYYFMSGTNLAQVKEIVDTNTFEDVFDVHEPETLTWVTNGYVSLDCGEEGLPPWGVCNLGSINLSALVKGKDIDKKGQFDFVALKKIVRTAVRFQDNVVDMDPYIFDGIRKTQLEGERRIGLGTMGLGDVLIKLHLRYGSPESIEFIDKVYKLIRDEAYRSSSEIAHEKGSFAKYDRKLYLEGKFVSELTDDVKKSIKKNGIRNSLLLMQAPTGSTSLMAGTTSGIEPVYEFEFIRKDRIGTHIIRHDLYDAWYKKHEKEVKEGKVKKPEWFVSANELTPEDHVKVQGVIQKYVDASISKTVNAPKNHTVEDVKKLYNLAYKLGCKGIAYMRDGSRPGVLERKESASAKATADEEKKALQYTIKPRPMVVHGATYRINTPVGIAFITLNTNGGNPPEPLEIFINVGKAGSDVYAMAEGLGRMISVALRFSSHLSVTKRVNEIITQLQGIGGARTMGFGKDRIRSLPDAVAKVLSMHYGLNGEKETNGVVKEAPKLVTATTQPSLIQPQASAHHNGSFDICPSCGEVTLVHEEGCKKCYGCGYSEC